TSDPSANPLQLGANHLSELTAIATEANLFHCRLKLPGAKETLEQLILRSLWYLLHDFKPEASEADIEWLENLIDLGQQLNLNLSLAQAQELYLQHWQQQILPTLTLQQPVYDERVSTTNTQGESLRSPTVEIHSTAQHNVHLRQWLQLGQQLSVDVKSWLEKLV
ncbi:MAG: glycoside hydrolase, partial [Cyanothece sp. SIO1E1]|nr:glycoside hydrolase [Cyanothece sp. SIO1E1]